MFFTTTSLFIAGLVAAAAPIAIHLLTKGKPRKVVFAGLRFTQGTLAVNRRRLRLKRLLLLSLRVVLFVLLGLALARPMFAPKNVASSEDAAEIADGKAPVAAAIVLDTSLRMGRVKDNTTLLERAKATARTILDQLPKGSEIAVLDGETSGDGFQSDRFAAKTRLEETTVEPGGRAVAESTFKALALLRSSKLTRREIYALTDRTTAGWSDRDVQRLRRAVAADEQRPVAFYLVDLGDDAIQNVAVVDAAPSAETLSAGGALRIDAEIERVATTPGDVVIEALLFDAKDVPNAVAADELGAKDKLAFHREKQTLSFDAGRSKKTAVFNVSGLAPGRRVGLIRTLGGDALKEDDARAFVVDVVPEWKALVVAPRPTAEKALFLTQALAPEELKKTGRAPFELDVVPYDSAQEGAKRQNVPDLNSIGKTELEKYRAIFLLDPPGLPTETLEKLVEYATTGGGIAVFLGRGAGKGDAWRVPEAIRLLGATPTRQETARARAISPVSSDAPLLSEFRAFERDGIPWDAAPVSRYWKLEDLTNTATVVARLVESDANPTTNEEPPAIVENLVGRGIVATVATPISDGVQEKPWNALTSGDAVWIFVVLVDSMARRLASGSSAILNYETGESVSLRAEIKEFPAVATIHTPLGEEIATPTDVERRQIRFPGVKTPGIYRVKTTANRDGESIDQVFAVAAPGKESDMSRRSSEEWDKLWNGLDYHTLDAAALATDLPSRDGHETEPYALLVVLLAGVFILETFVSNRFYKDAGKGEK